MIRPLTFVASLLIPTLSAFAEEVKWPVPPAGFNQASASIPKGTVSQRIMYPTRNNGERPCKVYTPPGYSATRAEKYPVLYLHHGIGGNENAWTAAQTDGQEGNADKVMDFLYSKTDLMVTPMIVVMPDGKAAPGGFEQFEPFGDILLNDLIPYIEKTYNASSSASMRGIAGLSMGGGQTLNFGYKNPTVFNWIGSFSPAPNTTGASTTMNTPAKIEAVKTNVKLAFLAAGTAESGYLSTARNYHNFLQTNGISPLYLQVEEGLNHEPKNWNRQLYNFAQRIFKGEGTYVLMPHSRKTALSYARAGEGRTASRFLVGRDGGAAGIAIFSLDGRTVTQRPTALLSGPTAQQP
jgi:enterochelin esterase-like enzyme